MTEDGRRMTGDGGQSRTEDGGQSRTEDGGQKTGDGGRADHGGRQVKDSGFCIIFPSFLPILGQSILFLSRPRLCLQEDLKVEVACQLVNAQFLERLNRFSHIASVSCLPPSVLRLPSSVFRLPSSASRPPPERPLSAQEGSQSPSKCANGGQPTARRLQMPPQPGSTGAREGNRRAEMLVCRLSRLSSSLPRRSCA